MDIKIPFLGDGIDSANVVAILVKPGDSVAVDQTLLELETDKATAPVPSLFDGVVDQISVKEGDVVKEGMLVVTLLGDSANGVKADPSNQESQPVPSPSPSLPVTPVLTTNMVMNADAVLPLGDISSVQAAPSIFKFARLSGLDLARVQGTGHGGRVTWDDVKTYVQYIQSKAFTDASSESTSKAPTQSKPR